MLLNLGVERLFITRLTTRLDSLRKTGGLVLEARPLEVLEVYVSSVPAFSALDLVKDVTQMLVCNLLLDGSHFKVITYLFQTHDKSTGSFPFL